jgi:hypothetical protein
MKDAPGNIFVISIVCGLSDAMAGCTYFILIGFAKSKRILNVCLLTNCGAAMVLMLWISLDKDYSDNTVLFAFFIFCLRVTSALELTICYVANEEYFPTMLLS